MMFSNVFGQRTRIPGSKSTLWTLEGLLAGVNADVFAKIRRKGANFAANMALMLAGGTVLMIGHVALQQLRSSIVTMAKVTLCSSSRDQHWWPDVATELLPRLPSLYTKTWRVRLAWWEDSIDGWTLTRNRHSKGGHCIALKVFLQWNNAISAIYSNAKNGREQFAHSCWNFRIDRKERSENHGIFSRNFHRRWKKCMWSLE